MLIILYLLYYQKPESQNMFLKKVAYPILLNREKCKNVVLLKPIYN